MWPSAYGTWYVALGVGCEDRDECLRALNEARETLKSVDPYPVITWSEYYKMFFLATRYAHPEDSIKEFSERLEAMGWEVIRREEVSNSANDTDVDDVGSTA